MRGSGLRPFLRGALATVVLIAAATACGGDGTGDGGGTDAPDALAGTHRYDVTHENLGSCTGAAEDGEETLDITFTADGLTLTNLDFDWSKDFDTTSTGTYERTETTSEGSDWHQILTLSAEGFVMMSETNDPVQVGEGAGLQPCLRYTYRLLD
jgi:hypothetical protein